MNDYERALTGPSQIFTLEINGRPTLVFEATGLAEAATLSSRPAVQKEISAFKHAVELAPASDEPTMAFLVKIDGVIVVAVPPQ
jgi:hypothetical protein